MKTEESTTVAVNTLLQAHAGTYDLRLTSHEILGYHSETAPRHRKLSISPSTFGAPHLTRVSVLSGKRIIASPAARPRTFWFVMLVRLQPHGLLPTTGDQIFRGWRPGAEARSLELVPASTLSFPPPPRLEFQLFDPERGVTAGEQRRTPLRAPPV